MYIVSLCDFGIKIKGVGSTHQEAEKDAQTKMLYRCLDRKTKPCFVYKQQKLVFKNFIAERAGVKPNPLHSFSYRVPNLDLTVFEIF